MAKSMIFGNGGTKMAARGRTVKNWNGPIAYFFRYVNLYLCTNFHAFIMKGTFFTHSCWANLHPSGYEDE